MDTNKMHSSNVWTVTWVGRHALPKRFVAVQLSGCMGVLEQRLLKIALFSGKEKAFCSFSELYIFGHFPGWLAGFSS